MHDFPLDFGMHFAYYGGVNKASKVSHALIQKLLFSDRHCSMCGGDQPYPKWRVKRGAKWRYYFWCSSECEAEMTGLLEEMGLQP